MAQNMQQKQQVIIRSRRSLATLRNAAAFKPIALKNPTKTRG